MIPARFTVHVRDKSTAARALSHCLAHRSASGPQYYASRKSARFMFHYYNALTCDQSYVPTSLYLITRRGIDKALSQLTQDISDLNGITDLKEWK